VLVPTDEAAGHVALHSSQGRQVLERPNWQTVTSLLFNDESSYIRFDMSEFSAEHADQRLIGAPPGYIGYDAGGELTNAIRERPFSVVLFDEIEKAHPRILDKFLQVLDDGVLTSGRGERVYFSEALILFTSNLGIYRLNERGERILNVAQSEDYSSVQQKVRSEIDKHFKQVINRPELLNRMGENVIVFDFVREKVAVEIFDAMVANTLERRENRRALRFGSRDFPLSFDKFGNLCCKRGRVGRFLFSQYRVYPLLQFLGLRRLDRRKRCGL
jgi:ATP-dependent Clp protease ATP-binding subunit ClpA